MTVANGHRNGHANGATPAGALDNDTPPQSLPAEESVLGAVLLSDTALEALSDEGLRPEHFYRPQHGRIYAAMLALHDEGKPVDRLTLTEHLKRAGSLDDVGGDVAIDLLAAGVPDVGNVRDYAGIVREHAQRREAIAVARRLLASASTGDIASVLDTAQQELVDAASSGRVTAVTAAEFLARPRPPLDPYVTATSGRTVLLAEGTGLLIAGPSGLGKSLVAIDLAGVLASDTGGPWLGTMVRGRRRVLLVTLEGSDEDTRERIDQLVAGDAHERLVIVDRWAKHGRVPNPKDVAALVRQHAIDVVVIDTLSAWFQGRHEITKGIPEEAHADLETVRRVSGRQVAWIGVSHTRKMDRSAGSVTDQLEEIAGTFHKKADAAIILRRDGADGPRRKITFAKVRRGPEPAQKVGTLPDPESDAPPRLIIVADGGQRVREGTEAERIAEWIAGQAAPASSTVITGALSITDTTLRRRRKDLEQLGIRHGKMPGNGLTIFYGTTAQWLAAGQITVDGAQS